MTELQHIQSNIDKWAKIAYGLVAVGLLVAVTGYLLSELRWEILLGPPTMALMVLFSAHKKSRVMAIAIIILSAIDSVDYAQMFFGYAPLFVEDAMPSKLDAVFAVFNAASAFLGLLIGIEAQKFHALVESRVILKNALIRMFVPIGYMFVLAIVIFMVSDIFFESSKDIFVEMATAFWLVIIFLAMWRKLPGTRQFPTVVWGEEAKEYSKSISAAMSLMDLNRLANTQQNQDGNYIVSPGGIFAKSYLLAQDQFTAYQDWHKKCFKVGWKLIFVFTVFAVLLTIVHGKLQAYWNDTHTFVIVAGLASVFVSLQLKSIKDFRKTFPEAQITKRQGGKLRRMIFAIACVPLLGTYVYGVLATFTGLFFLVPFALYFLPKGINLSLWTVIWVAVLGLWMIALGTGIIYARYTFKKRHSRPLTFEALADVEG